MEAANKGHRGRMIRGAPPVTPGSGGESPSALPLQGETDWRVLEAAFELFQFALELALAGGKGEVAAGALEDGTDALSDFVRVAQ